MVKSAIQINHSVKNKSWLCSYALHALELKEVWEEKQDSVEEREVRGFCGILKRQKSLGFGNLLSPFSFQEEIIYQVQKMEVDI